MQKQSQSNTNPVQFNQSDYLSTLSGVPVCRLKPFVESLLEHLGEIEVLVNRTGLVMLPGSDTVKGAKFHLGEILVSESHIRLKPEDGQSGEGYGACLGRDLEQSLAIAILDAAIQSGVMTDSIASFVKAESKLQALAEDQLLRQVEATRVEMETF